jgi:hypothetical protein
MPYKLRKAPKKDLYWVVTKTTGEHHSKEPLPLAQAKKQLAALYVKLRGGEYPIPPPTIPDYPPIVPSGGEGTRLYKELMDMLDDPAFKAYWVQEQKSLGKPTTEADWAKRREVVRKGNLQRAGFGFTPEQEAEMKRREVEQQEFAQAYQKWDEGRQAYLAENPEEKTYTPTLDEEGEPLQMSAAERNQLPQIDGPEFARRLEIYRSKHRTGFEKFAKGFTDLATSVADVGIDTLAKIAPGIGKAAKVAYKTFAPPGSQYYTKGTLAQKAMNLPGNVIDTALGSGRRKLKGGIDGTYIPSIKELKVQLKRLTNAYNITYEVDGRFADRLRDMIRDMEQEVNEAIEMKEPTHNSYTYEDVDDIESVAHGLLVDSVSGDTLIPANTSTNTSSSSSAAYDEGESPPLATLIGQLKRHGNPEGQRRSGLVLAALGANAPRPTFPDEDFEEGWEARGRGMDGGYKTKAEKDAYIASLVARAKAKYAAIRDWLNGSTSDEGRIYAAKWAAGENIVVRAMVNYLERSDDVTRDLRDGRLTPAQAREKMGVMAEGTGPDGQFIAYIYLRYEDHRMGKPVRFYGGPPSAKKSKPDETEGKGRRKTLRGGFDWRQFYRVVSENKKKIASMGAAAIGALATAISSGLTIPMSDTPAGFTQHVATAVFGGLAGGIVTYGVARIISELIGVGYSPEVAQQLVAATTNAFQLSTTPTRTVTVEAGTQDPISYDELTDGQTAYELVTTPEHEGAPTLLTPETAGEFTKNFIAQEGGFVDPTAYRRLAFIVHPLSRKKIARIEPVTIRIGHTAVTVAPSSSSSSNVVSSNSSTPAPSEDNVVIENPLKPRGSGRRVSALKLGRGKALKGGAIPSRNILQQMAKASYSPNPPSSIAGFNLVKSTPTLKFYKEGKGEKGRDIVIAIRGTNPTDTIDLKADAMIAINQLQSSARFQKDLKDLKDFQNQYPFASYQYYGVGHSLGGAILDAFLKLGLLRNGVSYNPAVQPLDIRSNIANQRIYQKGDPLYETLGRFTPGVEVRDKKKAPGLFDKVISYVPFVGTAYTAYANHALDNFTGGRKPTGTFHKQLRDAGVSPEAYLKKAQAKAKKHGLAWKHLGFSSDDTHKLQIPKANGSLVRFGSVGLGDHILYTLSPHSSSSSVSADEHRRRYLARATKIKGDWKKDPYSPNNLAIHVLW